MYLLDKGADKQEKLPFPQNISPDLNIPRETGMCFTENLRNILVLMLL